MGRIVRSVIRLGDQVMFMGAWGRALLIALFVLYPVFRVLAYPSATDFLAVLDHPRWLRAIVNTLVMTTLSTVTACLLGFVFALALTRPDLPGKGLFRTISILPLFSPPFAVAFSYLLLFGRLGLITHTVFHLRVDILGWRGLWLSQTISFFPIATLAISRVLENIPPSIEFVARNLGADEVSVFRTVTAPLARPGDAAGGVVRPGRFWESVGHRGRFPDPRHGGLVSNRRMGGPARRGDAGQPAAGAGGPPVPFGTALGRQETVHDHPRPRSPRGAGPDAARSAGVLGGVLFAGGDLRGPDLRGHRHREPDTSLGSRLAPDPPPLGRGRQALASCPEQPRGQRGGGGDGGVSWVRYRVRGAWTGGRRWGDPWCWRRDARGDPGRVSRHRLPPGFQRPTDPARGDHLDSHPGAVVLESPLCLQDHGRRISTN